MKFPNTKTISVTHRSCSKANANKNLNRRTMRFTRKAECVVSGLSRLPAVVPTGLKLKLSAGKSYNTAATDRQYRIEAGLPPDRSPGAEASAYDQIPMMPAYTPRPAVRKTMKPASHAYHPLSRQGS